MKHTNSLLIKQKAIQLGFDACGIAKIKLLTEDGKHLKDWINKGFQGDMHFIERGLEKRIDPSKIVTNAKSIIVLLKNYYPKEIQSKNTFQIAKYAYGKDYHSVLKQKFTELELFIKKLDSACITKGYTDTGSVLEKKWAVEAGLGWIGKQSLFISKEFGTYCFITVILTDLELDYDLPYIENHCGTCNICIKTCPTQAIVEPYIINAKKCISYLTIESKREIPEDLKKSFNNQIFGCDICQDVCPYNKSPIKNTSIEFQLPHALSSMNIEDWKSLNDEKYNTLFKGTAIERTGFKGLKKNIENLKPMG